MRTTAISQRSTSRACGEASRNANAIGVPTPLRDALLAATHAEATARHVELCGTGISRQTFELRHKILELEAIAEDDERIVEVHPEVSFAELNGAVAAWSARRYARGDAKPLPETHDRRVGAIWR